MKKVIRLTESDLRNIVINSVKKIIRESDTCNFDDFYPGDANQLRAEKIQQIYQMLSQDYDFIKEMEYQYKVGIYSDKVIIGYFDENKYGMSYSDYEDPDGDELDSIIVPLDVAWDAFLEDCYNGNYSSLGQFVYDAQKGIYNKDGVKFEEGSPFGYSDYGE